VEWNTEEIHLNVLRYSIHGILNSGIVLTLLSSIVSDILNKIPVSLSNFFSEIPSSFLNFSAYHSRVVFFPFFILYEAIDLQASLENWEVILQENSEVDRKRKAIHGFLEEIYFV